MSINQIGVEPAADDLGLKTHATSVSNIGMAIPPLLLLAADVMVDKLKATEPKYTKAIATDDGWVDAKTGELLVAIKHLKTRLGEPTIVKRGRGRPRKERPNT